ncbi:hypothetical protein [Streptomyces sp. PU-14G]|uniref:hypothetical protein n=1 Tax=Streptomyces sp. PU-14G TaxID=2800808 RepID=UPI0034DF1E7E
MSLAVLKTESRRSVAPWAGFVILAAGMGFLWLIDGPWWSGTARWTSQWTSMALWTRSLLTFLWPLAVGLGALQGLRDSRSRISELLTTTPRPAAHRAAVPAGATALFSASAFALLVLVGAAQVLLGDTTYTHLAWLPISLVGALSLVAGALFGMGVGRSLPSALTPPAVAVSALLATVLLQQTADEALPSGLAPNRLSLLSPAVSQVRESLLTLSVAVHLGQTLWLLGLAATGFALLAARSARARLAALAPVLAAGVLALLVLPAEPRQTYVVDQAAASQVCDGPVCVTEAHRHRLAELAPHGKEALRRLRDALGDKAPETIQEETALRGITADRVPSPDTVLIDFDDPVVTHAKGRALTRVLIAQGMAPNCVPRSDRESGTLGELAAQSVAAGWALGDLRLLAGSVHREDHLRDRARPLWRKLNALPRDEQRARIAALHQAALSCEGGAAHALTGGASR